MVLCTPKKSSVHLTCVSMLHLILMSVHESSPVRRGCQQCVRSILPYPLLVKILVIIVSRDLSLREMRYDSYTWNIIPFKNKKNCHVEATTWVSTLVCFSVSGILILASSHGGTMVFVFLHPRGVLFAERGCLAINVDVPALAPTDIIWS